MDCLKCGKKTTNEQVFCDDCLSSMAAYPVRPDAHVQLPSRTAQPAAKKAGKKRRPPTPEEQVANLRKRVRRLSALAMVLILLLGVVGAMFLHNLLEQKDIKLNELGELGKNYTFVNPFE